MNLFWLIIKQNKYKKQLELYQEALEQSFNKKVSKKYIYSTCLGQAIEI